MATEFPEGYDTFTEPSLPEETYLSQAGDASRNHVQHHRDMGDALEELQRNVALKGHDHSGADPLNPTGKLKQLNTHQDADTDQADTAIHHTLGDGAHQAAPGNHIHDYNGPTIVNKPLLLCTSTTRPAAPYPGLLIYESDRNRMYVWASFGATEPVTGIDATDSFDYGTPFTDAAGRPSLNPADWQQWYADDPADTDHGAMGVVRLGWLEWIDEGSDSNRCIARRIKPADKQTVTDDQVISWKTGDILIEETIPLITEEASNDKYFRMSADRSHYLRLQVGNDWVKLLYTKTGPAGEKSLGSLNNVNTNLKNTEWMAQIVDRTFSLFRSGEPMGVIKDTQGLSAKGPDFRGWGTGMQTGDRLLGQTTPADEQFVRIRDYVTYKANNRWTILPVANIPTVRLRQAKSQKLAQSGTLIEWNEELEDDFGYFSLSRPTDIVIGEPGLYEVKAALQWDPDRVPDIAKIVFCINGVETTIRTHEFIRGNLFVPGFSQTVYISGQIRFNTGDVLTLKAGHVVSSTLVDLIFSFFDETSKIKSRLDLTYIRV